MERVEIDRGVRVWRRKRERVVERGFKWGESGKR